MDKHLVKRRIYYLITIFDRFYFNRSSDIEAVRDLKEKLCYVALDYEVELHRSMQSLEIDKQYELPDGQIITLGTFDQLFF
jgi:actin